MSSSGRYLLYFSGQAVKRWGLIFAFTAAKTLYGSSHLAFLARKSR